MAHRKTGACTQATGNCFLGSKPHTTGTIDASAKSWVGLVLLRSGAATTQFTCSLVCPEESITVQFLGASARNDGGCLS